MITFQQFMETIAQLGPYTGDFTQARMALDKHEEGDATFEQIEDWVKSGLLNVLTRLRVILHNHSYGTRDIDYVINSLNTLQFSSKAANPERDPQKYASNVMMNSYVKIKELFRSLRANPLIPVGNGRGSTPEEVEYKNVTDEFFKIVSTHVQSAGTKELVKNIVSDDNVPFLVNHLRILLRTWGTHHQNDLGGYAGVEIEDLDNLPPRRRGGAAVTILNNAITSIQNHYGVTAGFGSMVNDTWVSVLKQFAKSKIAREATPKRILSVVDKLVAKL